MKLSPRTASSFLLLIALGCASVTVDDPNGAGDGDGDGDGSPSTGGTTIGNTGGTVIIGDGDGDGTGGVLIGDGDATGGVLIGDGDGDGDGDAPAGGSNTGGSAATGGSSSSCTGCKAWSEFGYHTPPPPTPGACVAALNGNDYIFASGQYNTACGPPGEAEGWCTAADGVFTLCN
jgi:hypothetical protein